MANPLPLSKILGFLTPPPVATADYDGAEYKWKMFVFRPACKYHVDVGVVLAAHIGSVFQKEAYFLAAILFYVVWYFVGKSANLKRVRKWYVFSSLSQ